MTKIKRVILTVPKSENGVSFHKDFTVFFLKTKGRMIIPAIKKRIKAKLKGGMLTRPIFVNVVVAPPNNEATKIKARAFCLSFIFKF